MQLHRVLRPFKMGIIASVLPFAAMACEGWNTAEFFQFADRAQVQTCLQRGADIAAHNEESGYTPLHYAARYPSRYVIATLLDAGADINARSADAGFGLRGGVPVLHLVPVDSPEVISLFVENGADVTAGDAYGWTMLHRAVASGAPIETFSILLNAGADPSARNADGQTPLHLAIRGAQNSNLSVEAILFLLDAGADASIADNNGRLAVDLITEESPLYGTQVHQRFSDAR
jgi:cytohesin